MKPNVLGTNHIPFGSYSPHPWFSRTWARLTIGQKVLWHYSRNGSIMGTIPVIDDKYRLNEKRGMTLQLLHLNSLNGRNTSHRALK